MPDQPPWEKYSAESGPWQKYATPTPNGTPPASPAKPSGFSQFTKGLAEGNPLSMREWPAPGTPIPSIGETLNPMNLVRGAVDVGKRLIHGDPRAAGQVISMGANPLAPGGEPVAPAMVPDEGIVSLRAANPSPPSPLGTIGHHIARGVSNVVLPGIGGKLYDFARGMLPNGEEGPRFSEFGENLRPLTPDVSGVPPRPVPQWQRVPIGTPKGEPMAPITPAKVSITGRAPGGLGSAAQIAAETKPLVGAPKETPDAALGINLTGPEGLPSEYLESAKEGTIASAQNRYNRIKLVIDAARSQGKDLAKMGPGQRDAFARTIGSGRPLSSSTDALLLKELAKPSKPIRTAGGEPVR